MKWNVTAILQLETWVGEDPVVGPVAVEYAVLLHIAIGIAVSTVVGPQVSHDVDACPRGWIRRPKQPLEIPPFVRQGWLSAHGEAAKASLEVQSHPIPHPIYCTVLGRSGRTGQHVAARKRTGWTVVGVLPRLRSPVRTRSSAPRNPWSQVYRRGWGFRRFEGPPLDSTDEHMFVRVCSMTQWELEHEIEHVRRSLAMLPAGTKALDREDAIAVLARLRDLTARLRRLESGLRSLIAEELDA